LIIKCFRKRKEKHDDFATLPEYTPSLQSPEYDESKSESSFFLTRVITIESSSVPQPILGAQLTGFYTIQVKSIKSNGPMAHYVISKSSSESSGNISRLVSSIGKYGESLNIIWYPNDYPKLTYMTPPRGKILENSYSVLIAG
jgi:hypothetical protein